MVTTAASVEWTVVKTEVEALQLEYSWIKEFDPRFNVKYRDDKSYPVAGGDRLRGVPAGDGRTRCQAAAAPATSGPTATRGRSARPSTSCSASSRCARAPTGSSSGRARSGGRACSATSTSAPRRASATISPEDHRAIVDDFCEFMAGRTRPFMKRIEQEMYAASDALDFEKAARLRDDLGAMQKALEKQAVVFGDGSDADVIAIAEDPLEVAVQVFYVRGGRIRGQRGWVADRTDDGDTAALVEDFLLQLYAGVAPEDARDAVPREILVPAAAGRARDLRAAAVRPSRLQGGDPGAPARRQAHPAGDGGAQRDRVAGAAQDEAGERPDHAQPRPRRDRRRPSSWRRPRCGSSATTSPTSRAPRSSRRWWSSRTAWRARGSTAVSSSATRRDPTTSRRCTRSSPGASAACSTSRRAPS